MSPVRAEPPNAAQIDVDSPCRCGSERPRDDARGVKLDSVPLTVPETQRVAAAAGGLRHGQGRRGIEATGQQHNGVSDGFHGAVA